MKTKYVASELSRILEISIVAVHNMAKRKKWEHEERPNSKGGGICKHYITSSMDAKTQNSIINSTETISSESLSLIPSLAPEAALSAAYKFHELQNPHNNKDAWTVDTIISEKVLTDPRVQRIARIVQEALDVPKGWKKSKWINAVAVRHDTTRPTIYKWINKYQKKGLVGLSHRKSNRGKPKVWTPEAIDWWVGLCLKHQRVAKDALYFDTLIPEAGKRGWKIGGYRSALNYYSQIATLQDEAFARGGVRALDNVLPSVLRIYTDLAPFEILVGDQHRFDFWVMDDETGEVFRPEGYFWQDLRTRLFYGGAVDRRYDSQLIGLALRIGIYKFGAFGSIYTDHGKPELSKYIMSILSAMRKLGLSAEKIIDGHLDFPKSPDLVNPCAILPGTHKKAIVRNAKAKMIEGTFNIFEGILRDHFLVPGYVKRLSDSKEEQEKAHKKAESLARAGKLLTPLEFTLKMYMAMDYYNLEKYHRGILREWAWKPKPKAATPMDCLKGCFLEKDGWRPRWLNPEEIDLVFLARADRNGRVVDRGRISFRNQLYEHDNLIKLHKTRVDVRYDPMEPDWVLCFHNGEFICQAVPVEYSSMKDMDLAARKISEKAAKRKAVIQKCRKLMSNVPDFLEYSQVPADEKSAPIIGTPAQRKKLLENKPPVLTTEQLAADVALIENYRHKERPVFHNEVDRYQYALNQIAEGAGMSAEDVAFVSEYESRMDADTHEYWQIYKESLQIKDLKGAN